MISIACLYFFMRLVAAHMEIQFPPPRTSKFNTFVPESQIDYNMNFPLRSDGSQLPCKRYAPGLPVVSLTAGQSFNITAYGTTFHSGGHCQFSISYDDKTFVVLRTVMKNCFVGTGLNFLVTLPVDTPSCDRCTIAWSWVNAIGNREFYMNCADVRITNSRSVADQVITGKNYTVANMPGYPTIPEFSPNTYDGSDLYASAPIVTVRPGSTPTATVPPPTTTSTSTSASSLSSTTSSSPLPTGGACTVVGETHCTGQRAFVQCTSAKTYAAKTCPLNTFCDDRAGYVSCVNTPSSSCVDGQSKCTSSTAWSLCSNNVFYNMGNCPTGTACKQTSVNKSSCL